MTRIRLDPSPLGVMLFRSGLFLWVNYIFRNS